jgi:hypothetical protein
MMIRKLLLSSPGEQTLLKKKAVSFRNVMVSCVFKMMENVCLLPSDVLQNYFRLDSTLSNRTKHMFQLVLVQR